MKLTKSQLKQIIKEELEKVLKEKYPTRLSSYGTGERVPVYPDVEAKHDYYGHVDYLQAPQAKQIEIMDAYENMDCPQLREEYIALRWGPSSGAYKARYRPGSPIQDDTDDEGDLYEKLKEVWGRSKCGMPGHEWPGGKIEPEGEQLQALERGEVKPGVSFARQVYQKEGPTKLGAPSDILGLGGSTSHPDDRFFEEGQDKMKITKSKLKQIIKEELKSNFGI